MSLQVSVLRRFYRLDDNCATLGPDEVQITWMDNHAVFVGEVEAHACTDTQMG